MTEEFRRELINSTKKNSSYLEHSAKGTSWNKKEHKYVQKVVLDGKTRYIYGTDKDAAKIKQLRNLRFTADSLRYQATELSNYLKQPYTIKLAKSSIDERRRNNVYARWIKEDQIGYAETTKDIALLSSSLKKKTILSLISSSLKKSVSSIQHNTIDKAKHYLNRKKLESLKKNYDPNKLYLNNGKTTVEFGNPKPVK